MDGRKLTVEIGPDGWGWDVRREYGAFVAVFADEADAHLFTQADALKRDNARMVEALKDIARQRSCGDPDANRRELIFAIEHARSALASLEAREDG